MTKSNKRIRINPKRLSNDDYEVIPSEKIAESNARIKKQMKKTK